jgi:hypothetical protein
MRGTFFFAGQGDMGVEGTTAVNAGQGSRNRADSGSWRAFAAQARRNAGRVRDPNIKATLLTIAERLERLALRAHELERGARRAPAVGAQKISSRNASESPNGRSPPLV